MEYHLINGYISELNKYVNEYVKLGWRLHSVTAADPGGIVVVVLERKV